ncbi:hypothetical protein CLV98_102306 [Dyadobacter jejuensis]|uniref:4-O-methyl-glucuronoyl methylesterase-like domain-containing protein n=1 Tax=Dyadobacter jejuensis TaxID=1082580 RepID=A0A316APG5_9BACT|nr:acetylxylan esterase [Dyadobacter jejuensis]PWJ59472.1 hypothetical protein CLV98_102306 [Dyadobacter jejuensis]
MKTTICWLLFLLPCLPVFSQNYDESQVGTLALPKVLKTQDGREVTTIKDWESTRRPEIISLFETHVYGQVPKTWDRVIFKLTKEDKKAMKGKATLKEVTISTFRNQEQVDIHLVLFIPKKAKKPSPAFLLINNRDPSNTDPTRKTLSGFWPAEQIIEKGYAIAAIHVSDAAPDNKTDYRNGVLRLYPEQLTKDDGMAAIGAWGWAASRVMDYFETDPDVNAQQVGLVGHSRGGKASLWACAQDERFAICYSNNSGNTGAALSKRNFGETVLKINTSFPYWFNTNYKKYNDREQDLPVDQHLLIATIAPRPAYITNASEDLWADPKGSFMATQLAEASYELYGLKSSLPNELPAVNTPFTTPPLGYHIREGAHNLTPYDWEQFIAFADQHYASKKQK